MIQVKKRWPTFGELRAWVLWDAQKQGLLSSPEATYRFLGEFEENNLLKEYAVLYNKYPEFAEQFLSLDHVD